jgi:hypothetical protein
MGTSAILFFQVFINGRWMIVKAVGDSFEVVPTKNLPKEPVQDEEEQEDYEQAWDDYADEVMELTHDGGISKDYEAYAKLADVRNDFEIDAPYAGRGYPKGFPKFSLGFEDTTWLSNDELQSLDLSDMPVRTLRYYLETLNYDKKKNAFQNFQSEKVKESCSATGRIWSHDDWVKANRKPSKNDFVNYEFFERTDKGIIELQEYAQAIQDHFPGKKIRMIIEFHY